MLVLDCVPEVFGTGAPETTATAAPYATADPLSRPKKAVVIGAGWAGEYAPLHVACACFN